MKLKRVIDTSDIRKTILVCPYCFEKKTGAPDLACCGEAGHFEEAYFLHTGEVCIKSEVIVKNGGMMIVLFLIALFIGSIASADLDRLQLDSNNQLHIVNAPKTTNIDVYHSDGTSDHVQDNMIYHSDGSTSRIETNGNKFQDRDVFSLGN